MWACPDAAFACLRNLAEMRSFVGTWVNHAAPFFQNVVFPACLSRTQPGLAEGGGGGGGPAWRATMIVNSD